MSAVSHRQQSQQPLDASRVAPRLYVGSLPPTGDALKYRGFDVLVLCALPDEYRAVYGVGGPALTALFDGVSVLRAPLDDQGPTSREPNLGRPTREEMVAAHGVARYVADAVRGGERALVTCVQGRNRSAFVAALALQRLTGLSGVEAADVVRAARQPDAGASVLVNPWFVALLERIPRAPRGSPLSRASMPGGGRL